MKDSGEQAGNIAYTKIHLSVGNNWRMKREGKSGGTQEFFPG